MDMQKWCLKLANQAVAQHGIKNDAPYTPIIADVYAPAITKLVEFVESVRDSTEMGSWATGRVIDARFKEEARAVLAEIEKE